MFDHFLLKIILNKKSRPNYDPASSTLCIWGVFFIYLFFGVAAILFYFLNMLIQFTELYWRDCKYVRYNVAKAYNIDKVTIWSRKEK